MSEFIYIIWIVIGIAVLVKLFGRNGNNAGNNNRNNGNAGRRAASGRGTATQPGRNETGTIIYYANNPHGLADKEYRFNYKKVGTSWRAYILKMQSLGGRDDSGHKTHRLYDNGAPYVCWDRPVATLADMQNISKVWADSLQEYIATGRRFG